MALVGSNPTLSAAHPPASVSAPYSRRRAAWTYHEKRRTREIQELPSGDRRYAYVLPGRGRHAAGEVQGGRRYGWLRRTLLQAGGQQSDRLVQGPGDGRGGGEGYRGGRPEPRLRVHRQHERVGGGLRRVHGPADDRHRAEGERIPGQVGAGDSVRRAHHAHTGQLRPRA